MSIYNVALQHGAINGEVVAAAWLGFPVAYIFAMCCDWFVASRLDLAIINPNIPEMTGAVRAYKLLANIDKNSVDYIKNYGAMPNVSKIDPVKKEKKDGNYTGDDLFYAVEKGLKNEGAEITEALLKTMDSMEIVNQVLIPALDKIGAEFEKGTLFLPKPFSAKSQS